MPDEALHIIPKLFVPSDYAEIMAKRSGDHIIKRNIVRKAVLKAQLYSLCRNAQRVVTDRSAYMMRLGKSLLKIRGAQYIPAIFYYYIPYFFSQSPTAPNQTSICNKPISRLVR